MPDANNKKYVKIRKIGQEQSYLQYACFGTDLIFPKVCSFISTHPLIHSSTLSSIHPLTSILVAFVMPNCSRPRSDFAQQFIFQFLPQKSHPIIILGAFATPNYFRPGFGLPCYPPVPRFRFLIKNSQVSTTIHFIISHKTIDLLSSTTKSLFTCITSTNAHSRLFCDAKLL